MKKFLLMMLGVLMALPTFAYDFTYTYEGQTLTYTVIDEEAKTCKPKDGSWRGAGNNVSGDLVIPAIAKDGDTEYTVTSIGPDAFYKCWGLTSVTIPNSVKSIGQTAFYRCSGLTSVIIPNSVKYIDVEAFCNCSGLTSVIIPNSVTYIDVKAFCNCSGLTSVIIGNSVTSIGESAFSGCSGLKKCAYPNSISNPFENGISVTYDPEGAIVYDGIVWGTNKNAIYFVHCDLDGEFTIPESVTSIGESAFYNCRRLTSVTIPNSVKSIGNNAFRDCSGLTSVTIPNSVTSIGEDAFYRCSGLTSVIIGNSVESIGESAFSGCDGLKKCAYPNSISNPFNSDVISVSYNPEGAIIEDGIVWGPDKTAIYFAPLNLEGEFTIPNSVTSIGGSAFEGCSGLTSIVSLDETAPYIEESSFDGLYDQVEVTVPDNSLNSYLSSYWSLFSNLRCAGGFVPETFDDGVFNYKVTGEKSAVLISGDYENMSSVSIPERVILNDKFYFVNYIGSAAFKDCNKIETLLLPKNLEGIGDYAFAGSSITTINLPQNLGVGCLQDAKNLSSITLSDKTETIPNSTFSGCTGLTSVIIPNAVESIGGNAFEDCSSLSSVKFGSSVESIGDNAFRNCALSELVLSPATTSIGANAFSGNNIKNIVIGANITEIGAMAFDGSNSLEKVSITAINPPAAENNTFSYYGCPLYVMPSENNEVKDAYYNFTRCWYRFSGYELIPIKTVTISSDSEIDLKSGNSIKLSATISPENASLPDIFWRSTDSSIATVDQDGNVTVVYNSENKTRSREAVTCQIIAETLYPDVPVASVTISVDDGTVSIDDIMTEPTNLQMGTLSNDIYNLQGVCLKRNATEDDVKALAPGLYIIRGQKVMVK